MGGQVGGQGWEDEGNSALPRDSPIELSRLCLLYLCRVSARVTSDQSSHTFARVMTGKRQGL